MSIEAFLPENVRASATTKIKEKTFDFLWTVTNYSAVCVNERIRSPSFCGGPKNSSWRLHVYPKKRVDELNYFALFLTCGFRLIPLKARYIFTIVGADGKPQEIRVVGSTEPRRFWLGLGWGCRKIMPYLELPCGDSIKIHCRVWITVDIKHTICKGVGKKNLPEEEDVNEGVKRPSTNFGKTFRDSVMNLVKIF